MDILTLNLCYNALSMQDSGGNLTANSHGDWTPTPQPELSAMTPSIEAATVRKLDAEADYYTQAAEKHRLGVWDLTRQKSQIQASSDANRQFHFWTEVEPSTVGGCMDTLSQWFREDPTAPITVIINSPGGSVVDGLAMFDHIKALQNAGATIDTLGLGCSNSMAGVLLQAGTTRRMGKNAYLMIHEVSGGSMGNASAMEDTVELFKRMQTRLIDILSERSEVDFEEVKANWKRRDWYLDADEALTLGFIDAIAE